MSQYKKKDKKIDCVEKNKQNKTNRYNINKDWRLERALNDKIKWLHGKNKTKTNRYNINKYWRLERTLNRKKTKRLTSWKI